MPSQQENYK